MSDRYVLILVLYALASFGATLAMMEATLRMLQGPILRGIGRLRPSEGILAHMVLRFLPPLVALVLTLRSAVPGYLRGEPIATHERPGIALTFLALLGVFAIVFPMITSAKRMMQTAAKIREWSSAETNRAQFSELPMIELNVPKPLIVASGLVRTSIFLSQPVRSLLSPRELRAALRHEVAHCRKHHNLLKLVFALAPHLFGTECMDESLCELLEFAADDDACSVPGDALNLAAAVVTLARESSLPQQLLYTPLAGGTSQASLERRVQRLVRPTGASGRSRLAQLATASAALLTIVAAFGSLPVAQHAFRETLEHLVR
jgi:hypothetical protein